MLRTAIVTAATRVVRGYTGFAARQLDAAATRVDVAQAGVLARFAAATARTDYGRHHALPPDADYRTWCARLPVVDWSELAPWAAAERDRPGALVAEPVVQWAKSRCAACPDKQIPYTRGLKRSFSRALGLWGHDLLSSGLVLRTGRCYLEIDPPEVRYAGGGEIADDADYVSRPVAAVLRRILAVDPRIRRLRESESFLRVLALSLLAAELEVISLWVPDRFVALLDYIDANARELANMLERGAVEAEGLRFELATVARARRDAVRAGDLERVWAGLALVSTPAEHADAPAAAAIARRFPHARHQGKGIMTTEAPLTIPIARAGGWVPIVDEVLYELEEAGGATCRLEDARIGPEYTLVISQAGGLARYRTGERVTVTHRWRSLPCLRHTAWA